MSANSVRRFHAINSTPPQKPFRDANREIRVMHLLPAGVFSDPVACELETVNPASGVEYEALSYTWGDQLDTLPIYVDGIELYITKNLEAALRHLRFTDRPRRLWADAVCINQMDDEEKSLQVQRMDKIFSSASKVIIWLGQPSEEGDVWKLPVDRSLLDDALRLARGIRAAYHNSWSSDPFRWAGELKAQIQQLKVVPASQQGEGRATAVLINLLGRPWFGRVWMIQEANVHRSPPEVVIGDLSARLVDFTHAAHALAIMEDFWGMRFGHSSPDYLFPSFYMQDIRFAFAHPGYRALPRAHQLLVLLSMTAASYHATDSRDRVYGLLALIHQEQGQDLAIVDYKKTVEDVMLDIAITLIQTTGSFGLFSLAGGEDPSDIPSWAPTWNRPVIYARNETNFQDYFSGLADFPGQNLFKFRIVPDEKQLLASAVVAGRVTHAIEIPEMETSPDDFNRFAKNVAALFDLEAELLQHPEFAGCFQPTKDGPSILAHVLEGCRFQWTWRDDIRRYDALMDRNLDGGPPVSEEIKERFLEALTKVIKDDAILATEQGGIGRTLLGLYGAGCREGDYIALFPGCAWPIHLRPRGGGFLVLGVCYLHGWMGLEEQQSAYDREVREKGELDLLALL